MFTHQQTLCVLSVVTSKYPTLFRNAAGVIIQGQCTSPRSFNLALCIGGSANENEVMGNLAAIVTDVERDTSQSFSPLSPHPVCQNMLSVGPVAAADGEIRAASWQLAAMLEASSSKRIYEGSGKKGKKKVRFIFSI